MLVKRLDNVLRPPKKIDPWTKKPATNIAQSVMWGFAITLFLASPATLLAPAALYTAAAIGDIAIAINKGIKTRRQEREEAVLRAKMEADAEKNERERKKREIQELKDKPTPQEMVEWENVLYKKRVALIEASALPPEEKQAYINAETDKLDEILRRLLGQVRW